MVGGHHSVLSTASAEGTWETFQVSLACFPASGILALQEEAVKNTGVTEVGDGSEGSTFYLIPGSSCILFYSANQSENWVSKTSLSSKPIY